MTSDRDRPLRNRALDGDQSAFEALVGPLVEPALRLAYTMLGDRAEAEDATQEAIARAWGRLSQLRDDSHIRPWFLSIVGNHCRNMRRTHWFRTIRLAEVFQSVRSIEPTLDRLDLESALARLPLSDRQALFMHFYLDLPIAEVAIGLGISPAAAKGRIYRACRRMRLDLLEEEL